MAYTEKGNMNQARFVWSVEGERSCLADCSWVLSAIKVGALMRILVVEDDPRLGPTLKKGLERHRYAVDLATNGEDALSLGLVIPYDLLVLDVRLPRLSGFEVCRQLRDQHRTMPILLLTALGEVKHRVTGLDLGADDYLTKPFAFAELEARVRALLRRDKAPKTAELRFLDITLNTRTREVRRGERVIALGNKEYLLLEFLMYHPRQVLSRSMIADHVWNNEADNLSNVIDVYIRYLRNKLCEYQEPDVIHTIRGAGYQLKEPEG
jgi:DNA-binding response OmpR family regulator